MKKVSLPPPAIVALSFILVIIVGTLLLMLPFAVNPNQSVSFVDAFFISTSSVCVTGLSTIPNLNETFSVFGKIVIALLIEIGGLGFVTVAAFILIIFGAKIGMNDRFLLKEALNQHTASGAVKLVKRIITISLSIQFFAFLLNVIALYGKYPLPSLLFKSAFHAISSFNNCGLDLFGSESMIPFTNNLLLNISTMLSVILGGLGFIVIYDVIVKRRWSKLTIHSKVVIKMSFILIIIGAVLLKLFEGSHISYLEALFQSVSTRTAGFNTINIADLKKINILIIIVLMFIGASPVSTGGGIKTTTFYVIFLSILSFSLGKKTITYNRKIADETKFKAYTLFTLALVFVIIFTGLLLIIEENNPSYQPSLINILFEITSAFGTVGLSMGITRYLYPLSKIIICIMMFLGRLGPLTVFSMWFRNSGRESSIDYVVERMIIG